MGLFDIFLNEDKKIQKHQRRLTDRNAQAEDREAAATWLSDNGSGKALVALVSRFDMNLENQLKDKAEKEYVYGLLAQKGEALEKPLMLHLKRCRQFAMPIRLLEDLKGEEAAVESVFDLLQHELDKDDFKPEKKLNLLVWLAERRHPGALAAARPFLRDFDEGVRYAAAEVLIAQGTDEARLPLLEALANPNDDSNRVRVRISDVFVGRRWPIGEASLEGRLTEGYQVRDGRIVTV